MIHRTRPSPRGENYPHHGFVGTLLDRSEYIEPERSALYGRYGVDLSEWAVVGLVTRAGKDRGLSPLGSITDLVSNGVVRREKLEDAMLNMASYMESSGLTAAPIWPGMSIVPIGVYTPIGLKDG